MLEIATTLGRILPKTNNERAVKFLEDFRWTDKAEAPEVEIAYARISPEFYSARSVYETFQLKLLLESASIFIQTKKILIQPVIIQIEKR